MTTLTDNFNRANQNNLGTSSQGTWSWSTGDVEVAGAGRIDIISNQAAQVASSAVCAVRAEFDVSTVDMYTQIDVVAQGNAGSSDGMGVACRMATGIGPSYYLGYLLDNGSTQIYKNTGGQAFVQLGSTTGVSVSLPQQIKIEAVGSAIKLYWAGSGTPTISVSDGAVTTGTRGGMRYGGLTTINRALDNFEAADVGGSGGGVFVPIIGRGPGMALVGPGGLAGANA